MGEGTAPRIFCVSLRILRAKNNPRENSPCLLSKKHVLLSTAHQLFCNVHIAFCWVGDKAGVPASCCLSPQCCP